MCKEDEIPASEPKREEYNVKEEPESPGLGEGETTQPSQPSHCHRSGPLTQSTPLTTRVLVVARAKLLDSCHERTKVSVCL